METGPDEGITENTPSSTGPAPAPKRSKLTPLILLLAVLSIILPVVLWQNTWFGTKLTDDQTRAYLSDTENPRHVQHALVQVAQRLDDGEKNLDAFYPLIAKLANHKRPEVRSTAAWVMGRDSSVEAFHDALRVLLADAEPLVRRNAALALSNFADSAARRPLLRMLEPFPFTSPATGTVSRLIAANRPVRARMELATLTDSEGQARKVYAPLEGRIRRVIPRNGDSVTQGDTLFLIDPAEQDMWEALRALVRMGQAEDIPEIRRAVDRYASTPRLVEQANLTCDAIEKRTGQSAD